MNGSNIEQLEARAEIIRGANRAVSAMRSIEAIIQADESSNSGWVDTWAAEESAADLLVRYSGTDTPFLRGFISALADYVSLCSGAGVPNLDAWKPEATMTIEEIEKHRKKLVAFGTESTEVAA